MRLSIRWSCYIVYKRYNCDNRHRPKLPNHVMLSAAKHLSRGAEILHGVYTERSECAQHDSTVPSCLALAIRGLGRCLLQTLHGRQLRQKRMYLFSTWLGLVGRSGGYWLE